MPTESKLQIFTAPGCDNCEEVKDALKSGKLEIEGADVKLADVEVVDLSSDAGYHYMDDLGISQVPAAYYGDKRCDLLVDDATKRVTVSCQGQDAKDEEEAS